MEPLKFAHLHFFSIAHNEVRLIPRFYALLPAKSGHCYSFLFTHLFAALEARLHITRNDILWTKASLDFETGLVAAFQQTVSPPGCLRSMVLEGCHFHFAQCLYRKLVGPPINLRADCMGEDKILLSFFKKLIALAFLPTNAIALAFRVLLQGELHPPYRDENGAVVDLRLKTFLEYFLNHWLLNQTNLEMFNCYNRRD